MDKLSAYDELKRENDALRDENERLNGIIEDIRVARWHETYNAALPSAMLMCENGTTPFKSSVVLATHNANELHGPLKGGK